MSTKRFTPEFKDEAVGQVTERGYAVSELLEAKSEILRLARNSVALKRSAAFKKSRPLLKYGETSSRLWVARSPYGNMTHSSDWWAMFFLSF